MSASIHPVRAAIAAVLILAAPLLAGCSSVDLFGKAGAGAGGGGPVTTSSAEASRAAQLISAYRTSRGLGPVVADTRLNAAATEQARSVAEAGSLSHGDFGGRMSSFGIGGYAAENLTAGSGDVVGAITRWKNSPNHNDNLLLAQANRIGLARADTPGRGYGHYWALVLAQ